MATWPDSTAAQAYIGEIKTDQIPLLDESLAAAIGYVTYRCKEFEMDEGVEADPEADPPVEAQDPQPIIPDTVYAATLMLTARLFRRRLSPEGVSDFGEFGAVRVTRVDPDIERLITPARSWGFA